MPRVALVFVGSRSLNKRICRFVESLAGSGFDPVVLAFPRRAWETSGFEDRSIGREERFFILRSLRSVGPRARRQRPGTIVCLHWSMLPMALLVGRLRRAPVIYDEHDHYEMLALEVTGPKWANQARSWWVRRIHAWCLPHVDVVTCIHLAESELKEHLGERAKTVLELHNYPSRAWGALRRDVASSSRSVAIVYVGGVWEVKGCVAMLDAFQLLAGDPTIPPVTLQVFGRGDPDIERRLAASSGVTFHGSSTYEKIVGFLAGHECLGLVLLEATARYSKAGTNCHKLYEYLAAGVPVLATDVGEIPSIIAALDGGWIIPAEFDAVALANKFREILAEPDELRRRGDNAATAITRQGMWWEAEWLKVEALGVLGEAAEHV